MVSQPGTRDKEGQGAKDCRHTAMCRLNLVEDLAHPLTPHQAPGIVTHSGRPPCLLQGGLPLVPQNRTTSNWRWEILSWCCLYSHLTRYYPFANQQSLLCVHLCQHFLAVFSQCKDKNLLTLPFYGEIMLKFWEPRSHLPCGNFQSWKKLPEITPGIHAWNFSESLEQFSWMEKQKEKGISCICGIIFPFINWLLRTFLPHPRNNIATKGPILSISAPEKLVEMLSCRFAGSSTCKVFIDKTICTESPWESLALIHTPGGPWPSTPLPPNLCQSGGYHPDLKVVKDIFLALSAQLSLFFWKVDAWVFVLLSFPLTPSKSFPIPRYEVLPYSVLQASAWFWPLQLACFLSPWRLLIKVRFVCLSYLAPPAQTVFSRNNPFRGKSLSRSGWRQNTINNILQSLAFLIHFLLFPSGCFPQAQEVLNVNLIINWMYF